MSEPRTCLVCGASNPSGSDWCGQCFARFDAPQKALVIEAAVAEGTRGSVAPAGAPAVASWVCAVCETENPMAEEECPICGTSMFRGLDEVDVTVEPRKAALWSLIPGVGLAKAGQGLLGLSTGLLIGLALASGTLFLSSGTAAIGVALVLTGVLVWGISAHDAYRYAVADAKGTLLRPRVLTVIAGGVLGLMALALVITSGQVGR